VHGVRWTLEPQVSVRTEVDDNKRLVAEPVTTLGVVTEAEAALAARTPISALVVTPRIRSARFAGDDGLDSDDQSLDLDARRQGERLGLRFAGTITRDTSRTSELDDTGRVDLNVRRMQLLAAPSLSYALDARTTLTSAVSHREVTFQDAGGAGLVDFTDRSASAGLVRALSQRTDLTLNLDAARFEAPRARVRSTTTGARAGLRHAWSERLDGGLELGAQRTDRDFPERGVARRAVDTGLQLEGRLAYELERGRVGLRLSRRVTPSASGDVLQRDEVVLNVAHRVSPRARLSAGLRRLRNRSLDAARSDERTLVRINAGVQWSLARRWTLAGQLTYTQQERAGGSAVASRAAVLTLRYRGDPTVLAR